VYAALRDGVMVVGVTDGAGANVVMTGSQMIALGEQHYLLIDLQ